MVVNDLGGSVGGGDEGDERGISTIDEYALMYSQFSFGGLLGGGLQQTLAGQTTELAPSTFAGHAEPSARRSSAIRFLCRRSAATAGAGRWMRRREPLVLVSDSSSPAPGIRFSPLVIVIVGRSPSRSTSSPPGPWPRWTGWPAGRCRARLASLRMRRRA